MPIYTEGRSLAGERDVGLRDKRRKGNQQGYDAVKEVGCWLKIDRERKRKGKKKSEPRSGEPRTGVGD